MTLLRTALANRGIVRLEVSWAAASMGMWAFSILLALYAYYEHGPGGVALAVLVRMLPAALLARAAVRALERASPRAVLVASALLRVLLIEAIAVVVSLEAPFAVLLALAAGLEIAAGLHRPARAALVTDLVQTPAELAAVNVSRVVDYGGFLAGALVAGILVSAGDIHSAFAFVGLAFVLAAGLAWRPPVAVRARAPAAGTQSPVALDRWALEPVAAAMRAVVRHPWVRARVAVFGASTLVQSTLELLLVVAALDLLGLGQAGVGWLRAAFAIGALLGGAASVTLLRQGRLAAGAAAGMALAGVPLALVAAWPVAAPALILLAILGAGYALLEAALLALTRRLASTEALALAADVEEIVYPVARTLGAGLAAWFVIELGNNGALIVVGLVLPVLALVSIQALRRAERSALVPPEALRLLSRVPHLAGLPLVALENLALRATRRRFRPGETIFREGDGLGSFHVIEAGLVQSQRRGAEAARLEAGNCFGHDALLRDGPPRSTVRALTPVSTLAIARSDFVGSVGARPRSSGAAGAPAPPQVQAPAPVAP